MAPHPPYSAMFDPALIKGALANLRREYTQDEAHQAYARGVLVGVVTMLMVLGWAHAPALAWCKRHGPPAAELNRKCIPPAWLATWDAA